MAAVQALFQMYHTLSHRGLVQTTKESNQIIKTFVTVVLEDLITISHTSLQSILFSLIQIVMDAQNLDKNEKL